MNIISKYFFDKGYAEQKEANQKLIKGDRFLYLPVDRSFMHGDSSAFQCAVEKFERDNDCFFSGCTGELIIFQHNSYNAGASR